jgi:hypothetical protein
MGFNLGAALGAGATSALNTYSAIEKIKQEKAREGRDAARFEQEQKDWQGKEALRTAASEIPTGDTIQVPDPGAMTGGYDQQDAPMRTEAISPDQKMANFRQRALALGADPTAVQQYEAGGVQLQGARQNLEEGKYRLGSLKRQADIEEQVAVERQKWQQKMANMHTEVQDTFARDGINGVLKYAAPQLKQAGLTSSVMGNTVTLKRGKEVVDQFDVKDAPGAIDKYMGQHYLHGFAQHLVDMGLTTTGEAMNWALGKERNQISGREVAVKESRLEAENAKDFAAGRYYDRGGSSATRQTASQIMQEKINAYADAMVKANPELPRAEAEKRAAQLMMRDPDATQVSPEQKKLAELYAEEAAGAKDAAALKVVQKKYAALGVKTGYVDPVAVREKAVKDGEDPFAQGNRGKDEKVVPSKAEPVPTNALPTNPYRHVTRGGTTIDQAALQADLAEYNKLANSAIPLAAGRRKLLEQKLRAAGAIE